VTQSGDDPRDLAMPRTGKLTLDKRVVELGEIVQAAIDEGTGSTFVVRLPIASPEQLRAGTAVH
jgi:hypothetical protein